MRKVTFDDTGLHPATVAQDVLRQLDITDSTLVDYVIKKTYNVYDHNERFRSGLSSTDPRGWYKMWVEHWIKGEHKRRLKLAQA